MSKVIDDAAVAAAFKKHASDADIAAAFNRHSQNVDSTTSPAKPPSFMERIQPYLPSPRTALHTTGAMLGGAAGLPFGGVGALAGGVAGGSIGESVYQIGKQVQDYMHGDQPQVPPVSGQLEAMVGGALQEGAPAFMATKAPAMLRSGAAKNIEQAVKPIGMAAKEAVQETAPEAVGQFPIARSQKTLRAAVDKLSTEANTAVNRAYSAVASKFPNAQFRSQPVIDELQNELAQSSLGGTPIVGQESKAKAYKTVIDWLKQNPKFSLNDFRKVKQNWDELVNWNKFSDSSAKDPVMADVLERASNKVRDIVHSVYPSLAKADSDASLWITLRKATKAADIRETAREPIMDLVRRYGLSSTIGGGIGYAEGGAKGAAEGAVAGALLTKIPQTVAWDTLNAATKAQVAHLLENKVTQGAIKLGSVAGSSAAQEYLNK